MTTDKRKVNLFLLGSMKSGTTSLAKILSDHPEICFAADKEPNYFSQPGQLELDDYHSLFNQNGEQYLAEGSVNYTQYPHHKLELWNDIHAYNPEAQFIYVLRNPVDRIRSHYTHLVQHHDLIIDFETSLRHVSILLNTSRHYFQIRPFIEKFGRDAIHFMVYEDLVNGRRSLEELACFLQIEPNGFLTFNDVHLNETVPEKRLSFVQKFNQLFQRSGQNGTSTRAPETLQPSDELYLLIHSSLKQDMDQMSKLTGIDLEKKWFEHARTQSFQK